MGLRKPRAGEASWGHPLIWTGGKCPTDRQQGVLGGAGGEARSQRSSLLGV